MGDPFHDPPAVHGIDALNETGERNTLGRIVL
jgi:hypothetical protein